MFIWLIKGKTEEDTEKANINRFAGSGRLSICMVQMMTTITGRRKTCIQCFVSEDDGYKSAFHVLVWVISDYMFAPTLCLSNPVHQHRETVADH